MIRETLYVTLKQRHIHFQLKNMERIRSINCFNFRLMNWLDSNIRKYFRFIGFDFTLNGIINNNSTMHLLEKKKFLRIP